MNQQHSSRYNGPKESSFIDGGLLLPSVVRREEVKYRKYRNNEVNVEISMEFAGGTFNRSSTNKETQFNRNFSFNDPKSNKIEVSNTNNNQPSKNKK